MDSNSGTAKRYVIGPLKNLQDAFPGHPGNDVRVSLDGKLSIFEVNLSEEDLSALKKVRSVKAYTHEEVLALLAAPESSGIWYTPEAGE